MSAEPMVTVKILATKIQVETSEPSDGVWETIVVVDGQPKPNPVKPTPEQYAHWFFWESGTRERINEVVTSGPPSSVLETLDWLLRLRIGAVFAKTGIRYGLSIRDHRSVLERST